MYQGTTNRETYIIQSHYKPNSLKEVQEIKKELEEMYEKLLPVFQDFVTIAHIDWEELSRGLE